MSDENNRAAYLTVGAAEVDITPEPGKQLAGYFYGRVAKRTLDPLFVKALWLENDGVKMLILSYDLAVTEAVVTDPVKRTLSAELRLPAENIALCATHTHTAPSFSADLPTDEDPAYVALLIERSVMAAKKAEATKFEASVHYAKTIVGGYSTNRLYRLADGSEEKNAFAPGVIGKAGPVDEELQTLAFRDKEKRVRAVAVNFACHSDSVGGGAADFYSADWAGEMGRVFHRVYGDDVPCLLLHGCAGDINPLLDKNLYIGGQNPEKAAQIGRGLAGAAINGLERAEPESAVALAAMAKTVDAPYYTREEKLAACIDSLRAKPNLSPSERCLIERFDHWPHDGETARLFIQVFRIGEISLVFLPGEVFCAIGMEIKRFAPTPKTVVVQLSDRRNVGYVPTTDQARRGAYGTLPILSRWLSDDAGRLMADAAISLLYEGVKK